MAGEPIRFGKYELLSRIAAGGMAEIFLARAASIKGFEKYLVIKRILPHKTRDQNFVTMFLDEARVAATLDHPNIVQIYDVGAIDGEYFIAMEYLIGEDLLELVRAGIKGGFGKPPLEVVLTVLGGALAGLHYAHDRRNFDGQPLNIVHRDVTPGNIVITYDGAVKLVDFGIAKAATRDVNQDTRSGALKGKIQYMSPEQCKGENLDRRADLFAVGIILYELTTGKRLYHEKSDFETLKKIVEGPVPDPALVVPDYPPALREVVMKALAKSPDARYATARELQLDLDAFARGERLVTGQVALSQYCEKVFAEKLNAWRAAEAAGKSLADRVAAGQGDGGYVGERHSSTGGVPYATASRRHQMKRLAQIGTLVVLAAGGAAVVWKVASKTPPPPPVVVVNPPPVTPPPVVVVTPQPVTPPPVTPPPVTPPPIDNHHKHSSSTEPRGKASVTIAADPWCEVLIDGKPFGQTPLVDVSVTSGSHTLTFLNSGANVHQQEKIHLTPGQAFKKKYSFPH
jgi:tRNA A-37 threonylcarbamoyl transferase component Bud32